MLYLAERAGQLAAGDVERRTCVAQWCLAAVSTVGTTLPAPSPAWIRHDLVPMTSVPAWLAAARAHWRWTGSERPPFAATPAPGQQSVWDFPRPPQLAADTREVTIHWQGLEVARTRRAVRVLETSHPPSFYLPWADVARHLLAPASGSSFCEWKGPAQYWSLVAGGRRLDGVAWSYPHPLDGAEALADCVAFYPTDLDCRVDGAVVRPQPGGFYGGWITPELTGPFKGEPGSTGW